MFLAALTASVILAVVSSSGSLTPQDIETAQKFTSANCMGCHHHMQKPFSAVLLKGKSIEKLAGHFQKKGKATEEQSALIVRFLTAVQDGKAPAPALKAK